MSRKRTSFIEGQGFLFEPGAETKTDLGDIQNLSEASYPVSYGPEGSHVSIGKRAELLESSLIALGKRNQRLGFNVASHTKPLSGPIWGRYEDITPVVIEGAQRNVYNFLDVAKRDFWAATGFAALRGQGVISSAEIDARGSKMWRDFTHKYGDPQVRAQRDKYKKQLKRVIKSQKSNQLAA